MNTSEMYMLVQGKSYAWVEWTCPFCLAQMEDPPHIKATTCSNGHIVYLGKIRYKDTVRRAYKTQAERRREEKKEKDVTDFVQKVIMPGVFGKHAKSKHARKTKKP